MSYRRGYFADGSVANGPESKGSRTRLLAGGEKVAEPELRSAPIIFEAHVLEEADPAMSSQPAAAATAPAPHPKRGTIPLTIRYTLPADAFTSQTADSRRKIVFGVAAFAFNGNGSTVERRAEQITLTFKDDISDARFHVDQQVNLPKGESYLYLAVWDMSSGRLGTLQIPVEVKKPRRP